MAQQPHQVQLLFKNHLSQCLRQIRQVPTITGNAAKGSSFIRTIELIKNLYPTTDVRQAHIVFCAIEMQIGGDAQRVFKTSNKLTCMLENNHNNTLFRTNALKNTAKDVIMRKLLDGLFNTLDRHEITNLRKFKQIAE